MSKRKYKKSHKCVMAHKNCFNCGHFIYVGEGDYICGMSNYLVVEEFAMPTKEFYRCKGKDYQEI